MTLVSKSFLFLLIIQANSIILTESKVNQMVIESLSCFKLVWYILFYSTVSFQTLPNFKSAGDQLIEHEFQNQEATAKKCKIEYVPVISIEHLFMGGFFRKMKAITVCYPVAKIKRLNCKINSMAKLLIRGFDYKTAKLCGTRNKFKSKN